MANNKVRRNGSYAPLSARYYKDDSIAQAGEKAELLYIRGLAFCAEMLSDGFISDIQLTRYVGAGLNGLKLRAAALVREGLWVRDEEAMGFRIRSWEKWNLSRGEIQERLRRDSDRKGDPE